MDDVIILLNGVENRVGLDGCGDCGVRYDIATNRFHVAIALLPGERIHAKIKI